jgi:hypothetical protein
MVRLQVAGRLGRLLQVVGFTVATGADSARNSYKGNYSIIAQSLYYAQEKLEGYRQRIE